MLANALHSELISIQTAVVNDRQMLETAVQATNLANITVNAQANKIAYETNVVAGLSIAAGAAWTVSALLQYFGFDFVAVTAAVDADLPGGPGVVLGETAAIEIASGLSNLAAAALCLAAAGEQDTLNQAYNQLSTDQSTLATAQANQALVAAQLTADIDTQTAVTAAYNVAEQAATSAEMAATSAQVVEALAQAIAAVVASATPPSSAGGGGGGGGGSSEIA